MGSATSTRWNGHKKHRTVEDTRHRVAASDLADACRLAKGAFVALQMSSRDWTRAWLTSPSEVAGGMARRSVELPTFRRNQRVTLIGMPMPFGGRRWWFVCPNCKRNRAALFLVAGSRESN